MKWTSSLRAKFTLVLLVTSLLSLLAAGLIARSLLFRSFNRVVMEESFRRYHSELTVYFKAYGSWRNAQKHESFGAFEKRRRHLYGAPPEGSPSRLGEETATKTTKNAPMVGETLNQEKSRPPFRFALADAKGRILMGGNSFKIGALAPASLRAQGKPVLLNGKTVAIALPDPQPNLNHLDLGYLRAVRRALLVAGLGAGLLALVMGLFVGTRFSRRIHQLTNAIEAMQNGELRQRVEENSPDEIGSLARAFNRMSTELAAAHEALQRSNLQIRQQAAQLQELSIRDALTGLYNRRHFDEQGAHLMLEARRYGRPLSVMIGDIDFFKKINDRFSHATGDEVLRRLSNLLQENTRESDVLARYGGEEFVIVFPQTPQAAACVLCEKLRSLIEAYPWWEVNEELHVTMSMGVAGDQAGDSFEKLLVAADAQLYQAKANGRNRVNCIASAPGLSPEAASARLDNSSHDTLCNSLPTDVTLEASEK